ncbi:hypothetical protein QBC33DRAFT_131287 [Phialemonium atrogriseum]|uniref:TMEM205-like domain-containing protein n=1 Tax=Phialemonium atrogriseum TaxID=1093897 RepID=A0AAJ0FM20_9PEZI|nr:uncharacterized protein QBC33DRAFT_131287 [Phialemonium atrogriseum]KAK1765690.1 hypothetical protein QBC33DRAFT_131287 [Phialemonium atrogriseum]
MAPSLLFSPAPYHILAYGTFLGTTFFHSFINGIVAIQTLPRAQFALLQSRLFPIYFSMQTAIPIVLTLTYPLDKTTIGGRSGVAGVLAPANRWAVLAPIALMFLAGLANLVVVGPATARCMRDRKSQERKDGKRSFDPPPHSQEMVALHKKFGMLHGISSLLNLSAFIGSVIYGITLSARIQ